MTAIEPITGCVHHEVEALGYERFKVEVFRDSTMTGITDDGEAVFTGGVLVATLYRSSESLAHAAGIDYSFVTASDRFRGVKNPDYGKGRKAKREES